MPLKISEKLAIMLAAAVPDLDIHSISLMPISGYYRIWNGTRTDCYTWTGSGKRRGHYITFQSWDTMTNCARFGINLIEERGHSYEVEAKKPSPAKLARV